MNEWGIGQTTTPPVQYGSGSTYQSQCPAFPAAPAGYVAWATSINGAIPADVQARATTIANDMTKSLGYTETIYSGGVPLLLRVDAHTWTTDAQGNVVAGCDHGVDVFVPSPTAIVPPSTQPPSTSSSGSSLTNTLLVASIGLGAIVSALSIYEFLRRDKHPKKTTSETP